MKNEVTIDRKTAIFYLTLLVLVVLDILMVFWILSPFARFPTSAYASEKARTVSDAGKPSPFEIADSKRQPVQPMRRKPRFANVSTNTPGR